MTHFPIQQNIAHRIWFATKRLLFGVLLIACHGSVESQNRKPTQVQAASVHSSPLANMNLQKQFAEQQVRVLGFSEQNQLILTLWKPDSTDTGHIAILDFQKGEIIHEIPLSKWLSESQLTLSSTGKWLVTINVRENLAFPHVKTYRVTVLRTSDLKVAASRDVPENEDVTGTVSYVGDSEYIVIKTLAAIPIGNDITFGNDRLDWLNATTGKVSKSLPYKPARECDKLISSPNKNYLLGLFYSSSFDPYGESDYSVLRDQLERHGFVDVIDSQTGKIIWHLAGSDKQPVGDPLFFISPTQFVSSGMVFNIATKSAKPWSAVNDERQILADVPGYPDFAFFWTKKGLELRNWKTDRTVQSWPTVKEKGHILLSPDLKVFAFKQGENIQFWNFDPAWLK
ncbi:MAG: hypothetical protein ABI210_08690 [Abditibacteriaceae bacterium]